MSFKTFLGWLNSDENTAGQTPSPGDWKEKRKENRVELGAEQKLTVHLKGTEEVSKLEASVRNVSVRGCGLIFKTSAERDKLAIGQILLATLAVDDFPIPLNVQVIRKVGDLEIGVRFKPPFPRDLEKLEKFLEPRCLGRSLREIDPGTLQKAPQKGLRWFQGVNETHLFSWYDPASGEIVQQQLVFLDHVIEWGKDGVIRTGQVRAEHPAGGTDLGWVKSELLDFDAISDPSALNLGKTLIQAAQIDSKVKESFLKKFK